MYRSEGGHLRRAFVRAPLVSVVPPCAECSVDCVRPGDTLVLRLAPRYYAQRLCAALGRPMPLVARFAAFDPFIRAITSGLLDQLDDGDLPVAGYLEPLGAVVSVHLARHCGAEAGESSSVPCGLPPHRLTRAVVNAQRHVGRGDVDSVPGEVPPAKAFAPVRLLQRCRPSCRKACRLLRVARARLRCGMRIVRLEGADALFGVYRDTADAEKRVLELSRYVRDKGMPITLGPTADDPDLLMRVGPLDHTQAMTLESAFRRYFAP